VRRIGDLAGDALEDILNNHPELKNQLGDNIYQLKNMGEELGPEAKKIVDQTWNQVQDILKGGVGLGTADQLRRLIQDKIQEVRRLADQAWQKGMEQAKPYIDKSPKVKELLLQNKDKLMQSNLSELWEQVRNAATSGDTSQLEDFITQTVQRGESNSGQGLGQYLNMIPGGSEIMPKLEQLQEITEKHGEEAEKLVKDAFKEIGEVLRKKVEEAKKLAEKAK
jgi:gas vesicle protein